MTNDNVTSVQPEPKNMLASILETAKKAYPDDYLPEAKDEGDTLGFFIRSELTETHEPDQDEASQLRRAVEVMQVAYTELGDVLEALRSKQSQAGP